MTTNKNDECIILDFCEFIKNKQEEKIEKINLTILEQQETQRKQKLLQDMMARNKAVLKQYKCKPKKNKGVHKYDIDE